MSYLVRIKAKDSPRRSRLRRPRSPDIAKMDKVLDIVKDGEVIISLRYFYARSKVELIHRKKRMVVLEKEAAVGAFNRHLQSALGVAVTEVIYQNNKKRLPTYAAYYIRQVLLIVGKKPTDEVSPGPFFADKRTIDELMSLAKLVFFQCVRPASKSLLVPAPRRAGFFLDSELSADKGAAPVAAASASGALKLE